MDYFSALADPTRRKIVELLAQKGQMSSGDIYAHFSVSHPAISQHLKVLRKARLVEAEKQAQQRIYRLNPDGLLAVESWIGRIAQTWHDRFDALDKLLQAEMLKVTGEHDEQEQSGSRP